MFGKNKETGVSLLLEEKAKTSKAKILLPEVTDERVLEAAVLMTRKTSIQVVLLGRRFIFPV